MRRRLALPNKAFSLELLEGSARELFDELDTDHQGVLDRRKLEVLAESIDAFNVRKPEILQVLLDEARGPGLGLSSFWYGGRPGSMEGEDTSTTRTVLETRLVGYPRRSTPHPFAANVLRKGVKVHWKHVASPART